MKVLYLIRGLPGSGKTTLARRLTDSFFEADQYFERPLGYAFDPAGLPAAHALCQANTETAMLCGVLVIAVSNTFSQQWEMEPYRVLADKHGYTVQELTMTGPLRANVHGVPPEAIAQMRDRWER